MFLPSWQGTKEVVVVDYSEKNSKRRDIGITKGKRKVRSTRKGGFLTTYIKVVNLYIKVVGRDL